MSILETIEVSKIYGAAEPRVTALRQADLTIASGELVAIIGPSGSGKSTLLHILGGLDFPTTGRVLVDGTDLCALDDDRRTIFRRQRIGFVFQRFNLLPNLTAVQNVALPLLLDRVSLAERTDRAGDAHSGGPRSAAGRPAGNIVGWRTAAGGDRSCPGDVARLDLGG